MKKESLDYSKSKEVTVEVNGQKISGQYTLRGNIVTVMSSNGQKSTQLGGMTSEGLAKILLRELATENNA